MDLLKTSTKETARQTIWQFIIFAVTIAVIFIGGIKYQSEVLRNEMDLRFEAMEKRMDQMEKNMISRFEDLKQEVRAKRQ